MFKFDIGETVRIVEWPQFFCLIGVERPNEVATIVNRTDHILWSDGIRNTYQIETNKGLYWFKEEALDYPTEEISAEEFNSILQE